MNKNLKYLSQFFCHSLIEKDNSRGFTLVELMVYMALFMSFIFLLSGMFVSILENQTQSFDNAKIEQDTQFILSRLQYDLGRADQLILPANDGDINSEMIIITSEGNLRYFLDAGQLMIQINSNQPAILTSDGILVQNLQFRRLGNEDGVPSVKLDLELISSIINSSQVESRVISTTYGLRF